MTLSYLPTKLNVFDYCKITGMTGAPQDSESAQASPFTRGVSMRDKLYILHSGKPPPYHSRLAKMIDQPVWPDNLWSGENLIYDVYDPSISESLEPDTLLFDSHFESGNLAKVYKLSANSYHFIIEQDPSGLCQWFYFAVRNARKDTEYQFYLSGFHKEDNLFGSGATIFYYSEKRARQEDINWTRGGTDYGYGVTCRAKAKETRSSVQFKIQFPYDDDICYICYALPYTYSDLQRAIMQWESRRPGVVTHETLCTSMCGRDVPFLTITEPESPIPLVGKSCIFLTGRIHPGESNGSYVLHGLVDWLLSDHPHAKYILDHCIVRIVPMIAVDGVVEGAYRIFRENTGDLNRMWGSPSPEHQPVVYHTKELIKKTAMERPLVVYIDFHGHSRLHGTFAFGCPNPADQGLMDAEKTLPRLFALISDDFSWEHCVFSFPKERDAAGRIVVRRELGVVQSFTIETSFGACKAGKHAGMLYDEVLWKEVGSQCGEAIYHYLIPTTSPLVSYVNRELEYFVKKPKPEPATQSEEDTPGKQRVLVLKRREGIEEELSRFTPTENLVLHVEPPDSTLACAIETMTTTPPPVVHPRWAKLHFSANC